MVLDFNKDQLQIVVARYSENLEWLKKFNCFATVYNKGETTVEGAVVLPNIGREGHTYLTHIVRNYHDLPKYTVFLQGSPFFHMEEGADSAKLTDTIQECMRKNVPFKGLAWFRLRCDRLGRPHQMSDPASKGKWSGWGKDIPVGDVYEKLFNRTPPEQFIASAATGLFIVRKDRILTRSLEFYKRALSIIEADPYDKDNTGHAFERLWQVIFNGSKAINP